MSANVLLDPQQKFSGQKTKRRKKIIRGLLGTIFLMSAVFYIVSYSSFFKIRNFIIQGNEYLELENVLAILEPLELRNPVTKFLGINNLWSWNVRQPIINGTALLNVQIQRHWLGQTLEIIVQERQKFAIWCSADKNCFWIDKNGIAFEEAPETEGSLLLIIRDLGPEKVNAGQNIAEERFLLNIIKILDGIKSLNLVFSEIVFDRALEEIRVQTYGGPEFWFSIRFDPENNFSALKSLLEKDNLRGIKYVDLRVENRIYYKNL